MGAIKTYMGHWFDPMEPKSDMIDIRDIAHALSLTCRGNGHVKTFFSVGQHCINCALEAEARGCSKKIILACLLHDATEAYLSDVPRPFKQALPQYREAEDALLDIICRKYLGETLREEEVKIVKQIDDDMLYYDMLALFDMQVQEVAPEIKTSISFEVVPFETIEQTYLTLYYKWKNEA